jgi:hypothetical protein
MRDLAYHRAGIPHIPAAQLSRQRVTLLMNVAGEPRGMPNVERIVPDLRRSFPSLDFVQEQMMHMNATAQLRAVAATSVLVTNVGSRSFRLLFLPDGAHVIMIGAPEVPIPGGDGQSRANSGSFVEVDTCWSSLGYVRILKYHTRNASAVVLGKGRPWSEDKKRRKGDLFEWMRLWDSDVELSLDHLNGLIQVALQRIVSKSAL